MKTKGKRIAIGAGIIAALLVAILFGHWRDLSRSYTFWRLDHVNAWEKATPLLERLAVDAQRSANPALLVERLGPAHQRYTFWFFAALVIEPSQVAMRPKNEEPFHALQVRLKDDPKLMAMWIQFLRWRRDIGIRNTMHEEREAALARVEFAQILGMTDGDEKRFACIQWVGENLAEVDMLGVIAPTLPFPEWSGNVIELPGRRKW